MADVPSTIAGWMSPEDYVKWSIDLINDGHAFVETLSDGSVRYVPLASVRS